MSYRPRLANGELVPLTWPIAIFRFINHICWPLDDGVSKFRIKLEHFIYIVGFIAFTQHSDADLRYLRLEQDIDLFLSSLPPYLILVEMHIRVFHLGARKDNLKRLLQKFYAKIYVSVQENPEKFHRIQCKLLPMKFNTIFYLLTLINFILIPVQNLIHNRRVMLHNTIYLFDFTPLPRYLPLLCINMWCAFILASMLFGETYIVAELMVHLNARYVLLRRDLIQTTEELLKCGNTNTNSNTNTNTAAKHRQIIVQAIRQNIVLNQFGAEVQKEFSFRLFIMFFFSAALLCTLCFKAYTNPAAGLGYMVWFMAKALELLAFGMLGSVLYETTDGLSKMYYESEWEQIIYHSSNAQENKRLMKLILQAIELNSKPFCIQGMKYFNVSLTSVVKILRGSLSYFTCLMSLH